LPVDMPPWSELLLQKRSSYAQMEMPVFNALDSRNSLATSSNAASLSIALWKLKKIEKEK
jgi:hypothetical protein